MVINHDSQCPTRINVYGGSKDDNSIIPVSRRMANSFLAQLLIKASTSNVKIAYQRGLYTNNVNIVYDKISHANLAL